MIKIVSFDLQGTITNASYSDEFWLELLPKQYSIKNNISLIESKKMLKDLFGSYGKYDSRYYSVKYWEKELNFNFSDIMKEKEVPLVIENELLNLASKYPSIIVTTTTSEFIDLELGQNKNIFKKLYSSLDTFNIAGKTKEVYELVLKDLNITSFEILHIGDNLEMDCENALSAGIKCYHFDPDKDIKLVIKEIEKIIEE
jgi:haloacid dehalogenase superfamily, subfamily IA, variant 1 with third motif having Dx(3-4)D or Dx(3-4)E